MTLTVATTEGRLRGVRRGPVAEFLGVRYGETTSGSNRFRAPVPVHTWTGIRDATVRGEACVQSGQDGVIGSEDCLRLNVWTPQGASGRPVMVFLHGGGYRNGSGADALYDGARLAHRGDVVVVTVTHRLNVFGHLYLAELDPAYAEHSNPGILDLVEALRWVHRNISAFGGDPANVTIFGESGGGGKVNCLLAAPAARGLFHKAIVQSGAQRRLAEPRRGSADTQAVLDFLGLRTSQLDELSAVPADQLYAAFAAVEAARPLGFATLSDMALVPVRDGVVLPWHPDAAEAVRLSSSVPMIIGTNEGETAIYSALAPALLPPMPDDDQLAGALRRAFPRIGDADADAVDNLVTNYRNRFPGLTPRDLFIAVSSDLWMAGDAIAQAEQRVDAGCAPAYLYRFGWQDPLFGGRYAVHAGELSFVFDALDQSFLGPAVAEARAQDDRAGARFGLRDAMIEAWCEFARSGKPVVHGGEWSEFDRCRRACVRFAAERTVVDDPLGDEVRQLLRRLAIGAGS